jgi:hypothetical protein
MTTFRYPEDNLSHKKNIRTNQKYYNEDNLIKLSDNLDNKLADGTIDIYEAAREILKFCKSMTVKQRCGYNRFASGAAYVLTQREKKKEKDCHPWYLSMDAEKMDSVGYFFL